LHLLEGMGHKLHRDNEWGDAECIAIDLNTGERLGASDGRNNGRPVGY
jgi:gamma-glutamyltranspeptidase / glutathione hydrolase